MKPALPQRVWFRPVVAVGLVAATAGAVRVAPVNLTSDPDLGPWWIGLGVGTSVAAAFAVARMFGLHRQGERRVDAGQLIATLSEMADEVRAQGVLSVVASPMVRRSSLLRTGLHLLLRDPDQALVRSVLGAHAEAEARRIGVWRGLQLWAARMLVVLGAVGGLLAITLMVLNLDSPSLVSSRLGVVIGLGAMLLAIGLAVTGPAISALSAAAAAQAFEAKVCEEAVLAIRDRADSMQMRARLERLMPSAAVPAGSEADRRRAA